LINNKVVIPDVKMVFKELGVNNYSKKKSMIEQANDKYVLTIDGYVTPWRLNYELSYNSCIILIQSKYYSWFYDKLEHMKNVYKIDVYSKTFEKDLYDCLYLLQNNDKIGEKIANGSKKLYDEITNLSYIKKYMCNLLTENDFDIIKKIV